LPTKFLHDSLNAFERDLERLISIVSLVKSYWILISVILFSPLREKGRQQIGINARAQR
jgi:hypothetical protein